MKLRNKKTGEIDDFIFEVITDRIDLYRRVGFSDIQNVWRYNSLAELNEEWEDYEEPKEYWTIDCGIPIKYTWNGGEYDRATEAVGLKFDTKEECEKAVEKLKAWKRLKDRGFRFEGIKQDYTRFFSQQKPMRIGRKYLQFNKAEDGEWLKENCEDLNLLFGGEE